MSVILPMLLAAGQSFLIYILLVVGLARIGRSLMAQSTLLDFLVIALLGSAVEMALYAGRASLEAGLASAAALLAANWGTSFVLCRAPRVRRLLLGTPVL